MSGQPNKQIQARIKHNRHIPKYASRRESFREFWRQFTLYPALPRRERRTIALSMWREAKAHG